MFRSKFFIVLLVSVFIIAVNGTDDKYEPTQVHLSVGNNERERVVTWVTKAKTPVSLVEYGVDGTWQKAKGKVSIFRVPYSSRKIYIHTVVLPNLSESTIYEYRCGCKLGWSKFFHFRMPPFGENWSPNLILFGDLGVENAQSLPMLIEEAHSDKYDAIFHIGDMAYDMDDDDGVRGDEFMRMIEPIAAYVPYMTAVGNHEQAYNFSHYKARFTMPGDTQGMFYSWDFGPIHFIIISTEAYYYIEEYGSGSLISQLNWLKKDLQEASSPENRTIRPWIITMGHRPMYCSNSDGDDCTKESDRVRVGMTSFENYGLEKLFYEHGVDLQLWAHEHSYERSWPVYNYKVLNGSSDPYVDPKAPVHIISGSAGCKENLDGFIRGPRRWSAFRSSSYGFARMKVYNSSHLHFEQVSVKKGEVIDELWIVKNSHGPYENIEPQFNDYYVVQAV